MGISCKPSRSQGATELEVPPSYRGGAHLRHTPPKTHYKGLAWDKQEHCWRVRVSFNGKQRHVGRYHNEHEAAEAFDCGALLLFGADAASNFGAPCALGNLARFLANNINMSQIEAIGRKRGREPALATAIAAAVAAADPKHVGGSERGGAAAAAKRVAYRLAPRTRAAKRAKTGAAAAPVLGSGADSDAAAAGSEATGDAAALRGGSPTPEVSDDGSSGTAAAAAAIRCTSMRASSEDGSEVTDVIRDGPDDADEDVMAEERQPCTTAAEAAAVPATAFAAPGAPTKRVTPGPGAPACAAPSAAPAALSSPPLVPHPPSPCRTKPSSPADSGATQLPPSTPRSPATAAPAASVKAVAATRCSAAAAAAPAPAAAPAQFNAASSDPRDAAFAPQQRLPRSQSCGSTTSTGTQPLHSQPPPAAAAPAQVNNGGLTGADAGVGMVCAGFHCGYQLSVTAAGPAAACYNSATGAAAFIRPDAVQPHSSYVAAVPTPSYTISHPTVVQQAPAAAAYTYAPVPAANHTFCDAWCLAAGCSMCGGGSAGAYAAPPQMPLLPALPQGLSFDPPELPMSKAGGLCASGPIMAAGDGQGGGDLGDLFGLSDLIGDLGVLEGYQGSDEFLIRWTGPGDAMDSMDM